MTRHYELTETITYRLTRAEVETAIKEYVCSRQSDSGQFGICADDCTVQIGSLGTAMVVNTYPKNEGKG